MIWPWVVGILAWQEWRWNRHQAILEQRANPKPPQGFGYPTAVGLGIGMTAIIAIPAWCLWSYAPGRIFCLT